MVLVGTDYNKGHNLHFKTHEELLPKHTNVISIGEFTKQKEKFSPQCCLKHAGQPLKHICRICSEKYCEDCDDTDDMCPKAEPGKSKSKVKPIQMVKHDMNPHQAILYDADRYSVS